jgi:hypothetical protein
VADGVSYGWVESMRKGELAVKAWAAPALRSAAPIDLINMAAMWMKQQEIGSVLRRVCPVQYSSSPE